MSAALASTGETSTTGQYFHTPAAGVSGGVEFLGCRFAQFLERSDILEALALRARSPGFSHIVTPNVDHVIRIIHPDAQSIHRLYDAAAMRICDSRVLSFLARLLDVRLPIYPGSDITRDLLSGPYLADLRVGVVGPSEKDLEILSRLYPRQRFIHISSLPSMSVDGEAFAACVGKALTLDWDVLLVCLGFPKQELFIAALRERGRRHGIALAVGASVDFLTGKQTRAPPAMQRMGLEWLYRLATSPRRLGRRYLAAVLPLSLLLWRREILPRLCRWRLAGGQRRSSGVPQPSATGARR
jgi:exopolysaccharide biosynthesis WecB/TagA/CpsF family protein